jgi:hypothetical protein
VTTLADHDDHPLVDVAPAAGVAPVQHTDDHDRALRGNLGGVSESVLDALAQALQLDQAERGHLFDLARAANTTARSPRRRPAPQRVRPSVQRILDAMNDAPADVRNGRRDILAANRLGYALYSDMYIDPARPANVARFVFLSPRARAFFLDWDGAANDIVPTCAPRPAGTPVTGGCRTWSGSCPPAARSSVPGGPRTTCATTTPDASTSITRSSVTSI